MKNSKRLASWTKALASPELFAKWVLTRVRTHFFDAYRRRIGNLNSTSKNDTPTQNLFIFNITNP